MFKYKHFYVENRFDFGREVLKFIAVVTMTIDHIGAILYPDQAFLRIIGRLSFPIFCYLLALGVESTRSIANYFTRLFIFALISQVPFYIALGHRPFEELNIFFTLSFGVLSLIHPVMTILSIVASLFLNFDYGSWGIAMIVCMRLLNINIKYGIILLTLLGIISFIMWENQIFSLFSLPIVLLHRMGYLRIERKTSGNTSYPAWRKFSYYIYYPLHLTILYLIKLAYF